MIKSLHIENFQSHKDTMIEFSPNVTAIVGLNNHGKSAVLRALRKVVRNSPDGNLFIRDGETKTKITLDLDSGTVVRQVKSDQSADNNLYEVKTPEADPLTFVKFGKTGIPQEVLDVLHVSDVQSFSGVDYDINFQTQFDDLFLVVGSGLASIRGKVLSKVTGLDTIYRAIQIAGAAEKKLTQEMKKVNADLSDVSESLAQYDGIDPLLEEFSFLKSSITSCDIQKTKISNIESLYSEMKSVVAKARTASQIVEASDTSCINISSILGLFRTIEECENILSLSTTISRTANIIEVLSYDFASTLHIISTSEFLMQSCEGLITLASRIETLNQITSLETPDISRISLLPAMISVLCDIERIALHVQCVSDAVNQEVPDTQMISQLYTQYLELSDLQAKALALARAEGTVCAISVEESSAYADLEQLHHELGVCPLCKKPF